MMIRIENDLWDKIHKLASCWENQRNSHITLLCIHPITIRNTYVQINKGAK